LQKQLARENLSLDAIYYCPHRPDDNCQCRKPEPELVNQAAQELGFRPDQAFFVGDKPCDIELGKRVGGRTLLVSTGYGSETLQCSSTRADFAVDNLSQAAHVVEHLLKLDAGADRTAPNSARALKADRE